LHPAAIGCADSEVVSIVTVITIIAVAISVVAIQGIAITIEIILLRRHKDWADC
jgi:hypothetical protein